MSNFTWESERREIPDGVDTRPDLLFGQVCFNQHPDGRWLVLAAGPARVQTNGAAVISDADARALAIAILRKQLGEAWTEHLDALAEA